MFEGTDLVKLERSENYVLSVEFKMTLNACPCSVKLLSLILHLTKRGQDYINEFDSSVFKVNLRLIHECFLKLLRFNTYSQMLY